MVRCQLLAARHQEIRPLFKVKRHWSVVSGQLSVEGNSKLEIQDSRLIIQTSHFRLYNSQFTIQNSLPRGLSQQVDEHRRARHGGDGADR